MWRHIRKFASKLSCDFLAVCTNKCLLFRYKVCPDCGKAPGCLHRVGENQYQVPFILLKAKCNAWPRYDEDEEVWVAKHSQYEARQAEKVFSATSHASKESLLLGTSLWTIHNDTKACSPNGTYSAWLTMTACTPLPRILNSTMKFQCMGG